MADILVEAQNGTNNERPKKDMVQKVNKALKVFLVTLLVLLVFVVYQFGQLTKPKSGKYKAELEGYSFVRSIYGPSEKASFQAIKGLEIDKNGNIYVADPARSSVDIFNSRGIFQRSVGKKGEGEKEVAKPWGVAVDDDENIYIADDYNHKVIVLDKNGNYKTHWMVMMPHFIKLVENKVLLSTYGPFYIYDKSGKQITKWAKKGRGYPELDNPYGFVKDGDLTYIADSLNNRLVAFNSKGEVDWALGRPSREMIDEGITFNMPFGLTQDEHGLLYLTDSLDASITVISKKDRKIVAKLGGEEHEGSRDGEFSFPAAIEYMGDRKFAVVDTGNNRVQIIKIPVSKDMEAAIKKTTGKTIATPGNTWYLGLLDTVKEFLGV